MQGGLSKDFLERHKPLIDGALEALIERPDTARALVPHCYAVGIHLFTEVITNQKIINRIVNTESIR